MRGGYLGQRIKLNHTTQNVAIKETTAADERPSTNPTAMATGMQVHKVVEILF